MSLLHKINGRFLRRLAHSNWREVKYRGTQELLNRWDGLLYRLGQLEKRPDALRDARRQSPARRFFFSTADLPVIAEVFQQRFPGAAEEIVAQAERLCAHQFNLLGYKNLDLGPQIDWHLDAVHNKRAPREFWYDVPYLDFEVCGDVKVTWELNRHQHFLTLGKAFLFTGEEKYAREFVAQFRDWRAQNPYPIGVNWASSLEVAFRSLSWVWARELFAGSASLPDRFHEDFVAALERNGKFIERNLSYYFSPNTHLLGEGVALFFIGTLYPELKTAGRWQETGWQIVLDAARLQVRKDGGYFEQSTYYHVYALDFFLHTRILAARNQIAIPAEFERTIVAMLDYLAALATAGTAPSFGDDDGGRVFDPSRNRSEHLLDPLATGAVLYSRPDFKAVAGSFREETLWLLGAGSAGDFDRLARIPAPSHSREFRETGTYILASEGLSLAVDAGPLGSARGGHGHADALSVCAAADGREWLSDAGTFTYTESPESRNQFRSTRQHNTLVVDGFDQAEAVEPFAWGRFPQVSIERWLAGETFDLLEASHDGYLRLASPVRHRRRVFFVKNRFWLIVDGAEGTGNHSVEIFWNGLAKNFRMDDLQRGMAIGNRGGFAILPERSRDWSVELIEKDWSPNYGAKESRCALRCHTRADLPVEFATLIVPRAASRDALGLFVRKPGNRPDVRGFEYRVGDERHVWVFSESHNDWQLGEFSSDAKIAYCALDANGRVENVVLCEGTSFAIGEEQFLVTDHRTERIEYRHQGGREEMIPAGGARIHGQLAGLSAEIATKTAQVQNTSKRP